MIETSEEERPAVIYPMTSKVSANAANRDVVLPAFRQLASAAGVVIAPFVAVFLLLGQVWIVSQQFLAGLGVGLVVLRIASPVC